MLLVVSRLDRTDKEHFHHHRKFYWKTILKVRLKLRVKPEVNYLSVFS